MQNLIASKLEKELKAVHILSIIIELIFNTKIYLDSRSFVITNDLEKKGLFGKKTLSDQDLDERINKIIFVIKMLLDYKLDYFSLSRFT